MIKERERYRVLLENLPDAFAYHEIVVDSVGKPKDYIFLEVNPAFEVMTGLERSEVINRRVTEVHPGIEKSSFDWIDTYAQVATTGQSISFEQYFELANKWYEITAYSDQPGFFAVVFRDITERKYLEDAIRERERSHAVLLSNLPGMAYRCDFDRDWTMRFVSEGCYKLTGYKPEELLENRKLSFNQVINPEFRDWVWEKWNEILPEKEKFQAEYTITTATGDIKWVWEQGQGIYDEADNVVAIEGFITDITDSKLAKEDLRRSEESLAITLQSIGDGVIATDNMGQITRMNLQAENLTGWKLVEVEGKPLNEVFHIVSARTGELAVNPVYTVMETGKIEGMANDTTLIARNGTRRQIADSAAPIFDVERNVLGVVMVFSDVTEQYQARTDLKESEARFRLLAENAQDLIYRLRLLPEYGFEYVSPSITSITGYTPEEFYENPALGVTTIYSEERHLLGQITNGKVPIDEPLTLRLITKNGNIIWVEIRNTPIYNEANDLIAIEGIARDITEIKKAEKEILIQKAHLEALFKNTKDAIVYFDTERRGFNINDQFVEMFGYELEEIKGKNIGAVIDPQGLVTDYSSPRVLNGEAVKFESTRYNKSGESMEVLIKGGPVYVDGKITGGYTIYSDISARKKAERELKYISFHDKLTSLHNRTYFEEKLYVLEKNQEYPVTIISIDVDGLKLINDTLGHHIGDELLVVCSTILKQSIPSEHIVARVGGDEFIAILSKTDEKTGELIVKEIQKNTVKYNNNHPELPISISIGLATAEDENMTIKEAYKSADDSMYNSKLHKGASAKSHIISALMTTLGERDYITEGHGRRLSDLSLKMGELKGLSSSQLDNLTLLAQVHDLGKVGIPDKILFKEGPLDDKEWETMRQHSEKGYRIAVSSPDLSGIAHLILKHHERWDGTGYPLAISGSEIPIECRILSIVDAYDAMTNDRPYSKAKSVEEALTEIRKCTGTQFDPKLVDLFFSVIQK